MRPSQRFPIHQAGLPSYQKPCKFRPKNLGFGRFWPKTSVSVLVDKTVTTLDLTLLNETGNISSGLGRGKELATRAN